MNCHLIISFPNIPHSTLSELNLNSGRNLYEKMAKKMLMISLMTTMIMSIGIPAFATEKISEPSNYKWEIVDISDIPEGIVPIQVDNLDEANALVNNLHKMLEEYHPTSVEYSNISPYGINEIQSKQNGCPMIGTHFNVEIRYNSSGNKFTACNNISSYLSGITSYVSWLQSDSWYHFHSNNTILNTHVAGDLTAWIISDELPLKHTTHYSDIETDFTVN